MTTEFSSDSVIHVIFSDRPLVNEISPMPSLRTEKFKGVQLEVQLEEYSVSNIQYSVFIAIIFNTPRSGFRISVQRETEFDYQFEGTSKSNSFMLF